MKRKVTVLCENERQALIKIETLHELVPGKKYLSVRYEWWTDKEKMKNEEYTQFKDGQMYKYCKIYVGGIDEEKLIREFKKEG